MSKRFNSSFGKVLGPAASQFTLLTPKSESSNKKTPQVRPWQYLEV